MDWEVLIVVAVFAGVLLGALLLWKASDWLEEVSEQSKGRR